MVRSLQRPVFISMIYREQLVGSVPRDETDCLVDEVLYLPIEDEIEK